MDECSCLEEWNIEPLMTLEGRVPAYGIVVLNRPISQNQEYVVKLWKNATLTVTTDGGTNHWDFFQSQLDNDTKELLKPPDLITGDFDSIKEEVLQKYSGLGSKIISTPDQDATDFTKTLIELNSHCQKNNITLEAVIVIAENSGRMDHIMANINTLYLTKSKKTLSNNTKVYLMSDDSLTWLLDSGTHVIHVPNRLSVCKKAWCALMPVGEECTNITTTGLKWNLVSGSLKFGELVSTSNTYDGSPTVNITCSHPILWSMKTKSLFE